MSQLTRSQLGMATDESGAYRHMLECEKRLKKSRKRWHQHVRATHTLKEKADELKAKLDETSAVLVEKPQWSEFWRDKTKGMPR